MPSAAPCDIPPARPPPSSSVTQQLSLSCPRCDSTNTKFCYFNNYNFSQPRHFCKSCRRYWTQGGTLRDVPIGGATRKSAKRCRTASAANSSFLSPRPLVDTNSFGGFAAALLGGHEGFPSLGSVVYGAGCGVWSSIGMGDGGGSGGGGSAPPMNEPWRWDAGDAASLAAAVAGDCFCWPESVAPTTATTAAAVNVFK